MSARVAVAGSLVVAALSLALERALSYDAWGWLVWGQEIASGHGFSTNGYPTWKPLTGLISVLLAPLGDAGPTVWLLIARAGAVLSLVLAYRLAARLAGPAAGVLAAVALFIAPEWLFQAGVAGSEGLLTAFLLAAVACHADRRDRSGFVLMLLASLLRPESWPALLVSAIVLWRRQPRSWPIVIAGVAVVPMLWFGGEYVGSGDPFRGGQLARMSLEARLLRRASLPAPVGVLDRAWRMVPLPLLACAPAALISGMRRRDPILVSLALGGLAWVAEVAVLAALGYAGVTRFLFPAAAALAVVGAVGVVQLMRSPRATPALRVALVVALLALAWPSVQRAAGLRHQMSKIDERGELDSGVKRIEARVGKKAFFDAPRVWALGVTRTELGWLLHVPPETLRRAQLPALVLLDLNQPSAPYRRALRRGRRRLRARTLVRDGDLRLVSVDRRP